MNAITIHYYKSPVGELIVGAYQDQLCLCDWRYREKRHAVDKRIQKHLRAAYTVEKKRQANAIIDQTITQLEAYFQQSRREFDIPLLLAGTEFQQQVWQALLQIKYGRTVSYTALADSMGKQEAVRAVASANGANAISIIVPCHRIIGSRGELVGYAGGLPAKEKLLRLENDLFSNQ